MSYLTEGSLGEKLATLDFRVGPATRDSLRGEADHSKRLSMCFRVMALGHAVDLEVEINHMGNQSMIPI